MAIIKYLDSKGLSHLWNKIKEYVTSVETQIFDSVDENIEDVAFVTSNAAYVIKTTIGADDNLNVHFEETNHFQECNSIMDALYKIDGEFVPRDELYAILGSMFNGLDYGSGGASGSAIGDFEEVEEYEEGNVESVELEDVELT